MKVSIIVPTFNRANMLRETLDSILNQTFRDFELILVDNCSVDNTEAMISSIHDERIRYFKHANHGILAINMNFGMQKAQGDYIAFCDDDDLWMPNKIEKQLDEFKKDNQVAVVCTNGIAFNEKGDTGLAIKSRLNDKDFTMRSLLWRNMVINSSVLIKKSVIDEVGMMDEEPEIFGAEEYSLWIRITKKYKIKYINEPLMRYRTHLHVYRNKDLKAFTVHEKIFTKLYTNKVIDKTTYIRLKKMLNYRTLSLKLAFGDKTITLQTILDTDLTFEEKTKLVMIYFLFRLQILDTLRHLRRAVLD